MLVTIKEYLLITLGLLLYTLAWAVFLLPNNLVGGGITGLGSVIQYSTGFNIAYSYIIINAILVLIAMKVLGTGFGAKTIYVLVATTLFLRFLPGMIPQDFVDYAWDSKLTDIMQDDEEKGARITEVTAYYMGLIDHSDMVDEWGLGRSTH